MSGNRSRNSAPDDAASLIASSKARSEKTWIITDGSVGIEAQGIAVAEAIGLPLNLRRVRVTGDEIRSGAAANPFAAGAPSQLRDFE